MLIENDPRIFRGWENERRVDAFNWQEIIRRPQPSELGPVIAMAMGSIISTLPLPSLLPPPLLPLSPLGLLRLPREHPSPIPVRHA